MNVGSACSADDMRRIAGHRSEDMLARWQELTRVTLPGMAQAHGWPIRHDHCFMRVCLDAAVQGRWDTVIRRPAIQYMTEPQLEAAVAAAERIVHDPALLPSLNAASLQWRRKASTTPYPIGLAPIGA